MTKLLLTLTASAAISVAALAQQQYPSQPPAQREMQPPAARGTQPQTERMPEQVSPRTLKPEHVRMVQQALNEKGGMNLSVDGRLGPKTAAALRKFQQDQGIRPSGRLDQQTLAALGVPIPGASEGPPRSVSPGAPPSDQQQQPSQRQMPNVPQPRQRQY